MVSPLSTTKEEVLNQHLFLFIVSPTLAIVDPQSRESIRRNCQSVSGGTAD